MGWGQSRILPVPLIDQAVVDELAGERIRQEREHPDQHLPDYVPGPSIAGHLRPIHTAPELDEHVARRAAGERLAWTDVFLRECAHVADAAERGDRAAVRTELIHSAAVALRWINDLDRSAEAPSAA